MIIPQAKVLKNLAESLDSLIKTNPLAYQSAIDGLDLFADVDRLEEWGLGRIRPKEVRV